MSEAAVIHIIDDDESMRSTATPWSPECRQLATRPRYAPCVAASAPSRCDRENHARVGGGTSASFLAIRRRSAFEPIADVRLRRPSAHLHLWVHAL